MLSNHINNVRDNLNVDRERNYLDSELSEFKFPSFLLFRLKHIQLSQRLRKKKLGFDKRQCL